MTDGVSEIRAAYDKTVAAATARIKYATEMTWRMPRLPEPKQRSAVRQAMINIAKSAGKTVGKGAWRLATRKHDFRHQEADGFIDCAGRRWMLDYGSYARLHIDDQEWSGRSGRPLTTLPADPPRTTSPLWLIDLVRGVDAADDHGSTDIDGQQWHRFDVTADLSRAAATQSAAMPSPARDRYEQLLALPFQLWIGDGYLRRIRFAADNSVTEITLSDFGAQLDDLDWSRLPTFRSPDEAAAVRELHEADDGEQPDQQSEPAERET
ncbi:hypothetical protein [Microlunatus soli]|uniref:Uncharacterized protein n=1 Tax=Microlunatus soli TaxID=630515 RepID=A0A1H1QIZ2_9ACTN|nr:hypothetical protein [Microlunatus soli]SDS23346.1 hypothetical protein SAMN04489812_1285 [Microlunatus soli]